MSERLVCRCAHCGNGRTGQLDRRLDGGFTLPSKIHRYIMVDGAYVKARRSGVNESTVERHPGDGRRLKIGVRMRCDSCREFTFYSPEALADAMTNRTRGVIGVKEIPQPHR